MPSTTRCCAHRRASVPHGASSWAPARADGAEHTATRDRFAEYRRTGDRSLRDRLVEDHTNLAYAQARRYLRPSVRLEDLRQIALIGLLKAVERYDPSLGTTFPTFAIPTIRGEIKRHYRDRAWLVRPPRGVQEDVLAIRAAVDTLTQENGQSPAVAQISERTGLSRDRVVEGLAAADFMNSSWLTPEAEESISSVAPLESERVEEHVTVMKLLSRLPTRDRTVVLLRFFDGLSQSQIAARVGVSQMQISRILTKSLATLRAVSPESVGIQDRAIAGRAATCMPVMTSRGGEPGQDGFRHVAL